MNRPLTDGELEAMAAAVCSAATHGGGAVGAVGTVKRSAGVEPLAVAPQRFRIGRLTKKGSGKLPAKTFIYRHNPSVDFTAR